MSSPTHHQNQTKQTNLGTTSQVETLVMIITITSSLVLLLALTESRVLLPTNANDIIGQTCKRTPYYDVCVANLRSNPGSLGADVKGLAIIMVGAVGAKANETLSHINELIKRSHKDDEKKALSSCDICYDIGILSTDAPIAIDALNAGDFQSAENFLNDAANEAVACGKSFSGKSPLIKMNKVVHDLAAVAAAVTKILL